MPPHTTSPTPDNQGLGITFATLSPPPFETAAPRSTGMGPRPRATPSSPNRLPPSLAQPQPSPTRLPPPPRAQGQQQPAFSLKPTHTRQGSSSKGFATFSAIPPAAARPMGPRGVGVQSPKLGGPSTESESDHSESHTADSRHSDTYEKEDETPKQRLRPLPISPSRSGSVASHMTTSSKHARRVRSTEILRKYSKSDNTSGGRTDKYLPLSGEDEHETLHPGLQREPSSTTVETSAAPLSFLRRPSTRMTDVSETASDVASGSRDRTSPSKMSAHTHQTTYTDESGSDYITRQLPFPPIHPHRTATTYSDPTTGGPAYQGQNLHPMSRSISQPQHLFGVPDFESDRSGPTHGLFDHGHPPMTNRASDVAFAPTGDENLRIRQLTYGSGTGLPPAPTSPSVGQVERHSSSDSQEDLRSRPWSESTMSEHVRKPTMLGHRGRSLSDGAQLLARQGTLLHPASSKQRASAELGVLLGAPRSRRLSRDKLLPPPPTEADQKQSAWEKNNKVRLEAAKKGKARVEVDVVLERECVVEGGEVRGRMEVRITGGRRGEGLRVGGGKVRVVGFEELSAASRHIFYHQPYTLPVFDPSIQHNLSSSLFASGPDSDGYRLASEGTHSIPFRMRLPLGGGAKGTYTSPNGKGACVRYVVVGSIKIHIPSTGKRSIAHFYRSVVVLPYLNPGLVLAPSPEPVEGYVERGLGWSLTGEKGRVELRVSLGRKFWVSGQRLWCEVAITNNSNRKIKTLNMALLQTVQVFNPQPLDTADVATRLMHKRRSLPSCASDQSTPDLDACQTTTQRKKMAEEATEADFSGSGAGRVTGKGWWTGVETGESGHWDMSLQVPPGLLSLRRTRLIEVQYTLRVTVNGSIYVDVPVELINFLSIDPPPMPRDGPSALVRPVSQTHAVPNGQPGHAPYQSRPQALRGSSEFSEASAVGPARASSTTLHIDALLQAGRARAEAEAMGQLTPLAQADRPRPLSLGSSYSVSRPDPPTVMGRMKSNPQLRSMPKGARFMSYANSSRTDAHSVFSGEEVEEVEEEEEEDIDESDKAALAARRALGRQMSLAAIHRAMDREQKKLDELDQAHQGPVSPTAETPPQGEFRPCETPSEEVYEMVGDTPQVESRDNAQTPLPIDSPVQQRRSLRITNSDPSVEDGSDEEGEEADNHQQAASVETHEQRHFEMIEEEEEEEEDEGMEVGNETVLASMIPEERAELQELMSAHGHDAGDHEYDYGEEVEVETEAGDDGAHEIEHEQRDDHVIEDGLTNPPPSEPVDHDHYEPLASPQTPYGGLETPMMTQQESEIGQVYEAVKRNVSVRVPSKLLPLLSAEDASGATRDEERENKDKDRKDVVLGLPRSTSVSHSILAGARRASQTAESRRDSVSSASARLASPGPGPIAMSRKGSALSNSGTGAGAGTRRDSSLLLSPASPLRTQNPSSPTPVARVIQKKNSFTFATPRSPIKVKIPITSSPTPLDPKALSPSSALSPKSIVRSPSGLTAPAGAGAEMSRQPSVNSRLRNLVVASINSPSQSSESGDEHHPPGLAPSVISDSASSEGHALESPSSVQMPHIETGLEQSASPATSKRTLPFARVNAAYQPFANLDMQQTQKAMMRDHSWTPDQEYLQARVHYASTHTYTQHALEPPRAFDSASMIASISQQQRQSSLHIPIDEISPGPSPHSSPSSCHSILPSVKTKIAQLESRDEALRRFSVSGASGSSSVAPSRQTSAGLGLHTSPVAAKRRSYTAALAPRVARSPSTDLRASASAIAEQNEGRYRYGTAGAESYSPSERQRLPLPTQNERPHPPQPQRAGTKAGSEEQPDVSYLFKKSSVSRLPPPDRQSSSGWLEGQRPTAYTRNDYISGSVRSHVSNDYAPSGPMSPRVGADAMRIAEVEAGEVLDPFGLGASARSSMYDSFDGRLEDVREDDVGMERNLSARTDFTAGTGVDERALISNYGHSSYCEDDYQEEGGEDEDEDEDRVLRAKASGVWEGGDGVGPRFTEGTGYRASTVESSKDTDESEGLL